MPNSPPTCDACITFNDGYRAASKQAIAACQLLLAGWSELDPAACEVAKISGGISNLLVKVSPPASTGLQSVAVKVFGEKTELLIDREVERRVLLQLNKAGFGAKVVGLFGNGRIEEFLECKTLTPEEMADPAFVPRIATRLREFHGLQLDLPREPTLWATINGWLAQARQLSFPNPEKQRQYGAIDFAAMDAQVRELQALCARTASPAVFSHNDLLSGNILILQLAGGAGPGGEGPMQFIDFEYSAYGFRGFDFGNHFNEYAGFDCDYGRYPDAAAQRMFFMHYLRPEELEALRGSGGEAGVEAALSKLSAEANIWALASHAYWGVWALIQARYSPIQFDYLSYSGMRWAEFHRRKQAFVAQLDAAFPPS